jgi:hypothetical protein
MYTPLTPESENPWAMSMAVRIRVNPAATENLAWRLLAGVRRSLPSFDQKPTAAGQSPVNAFSRRRRWPKASVYRGLAGSHP